MKNSAKKWGIAIIIIVILAVAYYLISPIWRVVEMNEASPLTKTNKEVSVISENDNEALPVTETNKEVSVISEGNFLAQAHDVAGKAILIQDQEQKVLRFENFETINGPNLHIYLSADTEGSDYIDLGPIKATVGNVNYQLDSAIDTDKYNKVLVWCVPFKVLFSFAELK